MHKCFKAQSDFQCFLFNFKMFQGFHLYLWIPIIQAYTSVDVNHDYNFYVQGKQSHMS